MKCFYHSADFDGKCSGAIVKMVHPECEMIGIDYGHDFPWDEIGEGETVWMVDFSLPADDMLRLHKACYLIWIDHHQTALDAIPLELHEEILGSREVGRAGCELTWAYLKPKDPEPRVVHLLGRWDVWDHTDPDMKALQLGLRTHGYMAPDHELWPHMLNGSGYGVNFLEDSTEAGRTICQYQENQDAGKCAVIAFETVLDHLRFVAMNTGHGSLQFATVWNPDKYDGMLAFSWSAKISAWKCSMYNEDGQADLSVIAKTRGGGGHAHACGFECTELPFPLTGMQPERAK